MDAKEAAETYGEWLKVYPWNVWATLTFRHPPSVKRALEAWDSASAMLGRSSFWWVATEEGRLFGRVHLHGLLGNTQASLGRRPAVDRGASLNEWWRKRYGIAHVRDYDPDKGASHYIAKYVAKGLGEWKAGGPWPDIEQALEQDTLIQHYEKALTSSDKRRLGWA